MNLVVTAYGEKKRGNIWNFESGLHEMRKVALELTKVFFSLSLVWPNS